VSNAVSGLPIGEVARLSGTPITTLRYYEQRGLVSPPERVNGHRRYPASIIVSLTVIRYCRAAGLRLDEIALVLNDRSPNRAATRDLARQRLRSIDEQIQGLQLARRLIEAAASCCCPTADCRCGALDPVRAEAAALRLACPLDL
jgi:MerR family transcriptional regulator, redox-sensitive transcriptional activator SoxR